jgi:flagellar basal body-associated protein FliL
MGHNVGMQDAFAIVLFVVVFLAAIGALITFMGSSRPYGQIGRGGMSLNEDREDHRRVRTDSRPAAVVSAERDVEIRQLLDARNERRARRGQAPLDVEAELSRLTAPAVDAGLQDEVRSLVVARNERRVRQGKEPLDVEAEVARQLRDLSAG